MANQQVIIRPGSIKHRHAKGSDRPARRPKSKTAFHRITVAACAKRSLSASYCLLLVRWFSRSIIGWMVAVAQFVGDVFLQAVEVVQFFFAGGDEFLLEEIPFEGAK